MEYPDHTPSPPDDYYTLGTDDPPEDPDDPPIIITGEGGTILQKNIRIRIITPEEDQVFTADGDGMVSLALHGKITYKKRPSDPNRVSLPDQYYEWLIDQDPTVVLTGAQGTVQVRLVPGKHDVILRIGQTSHFNKVAIDVIAGIAPMPAPASETVSLLQRILNFFRRLFGG